MKKRSRIILGMAALGVAAVGAFSFNVDTAANQAWYIPDTGGCVSFGNVECEPQPMGDCTIPSGPLAGKQLYLEGCTQRLDREEGF